MVPGSVDRKVVCRLRSVLPLQRARQRSVQHVDEAERAVGSQHCQAQPHSTRTGLRCQRVIHSAGVEAQQHDPGQKYECALSAAPATVRLSGMKCSCRMPNCAAGIGSASAQVSLSTARSQQNSSVVAPPATSSP